jgi:hypothetical protein
VDCGTRATLAYDTLVRVKTRTNSTTRTENKGVLGGAISGSYPKESLFGAWSAEMWLGTGVSGVLLAI